MTRKYNIPYRLHNKAKLRAKRKGLSFSIAVADIQVPDTCPLLGIPLFMGTRVCCANSPTLDRIDSTKGYEIGNVWVISHKANSIKSNATTQELVLLATNLLSSGITSV